MSGRHWLNNLFQKVRHFVRRYSYLIAPFFSAAIGIVLVHFRVIELGDAKKDTIAAIAGVLAGFMFACVSIYISLPISNPFIQALKQTGHSTILYKNMYYSIFMGAFSMLISLTIVPVIITFAMFAASIGNASIAVYYIYSITRDL